MSSKNQKNLEPNKYLLLPVALILKEPIKKTAPIGAVKINRMNRRLAVKAF